MKRLSEHAFIFATLSPRPTPCWRNLCASHQSLLTCSIPYARQCPDCARARSDMIPVLVFSYIIYLATTYLYMERKRVYDLVMPFPAPLPSPPFYFVHRPRTFGHECLYMTYSTHPHLHLHTTYVSFLGTVGRCLSFICLSRILEFWDCDYCGACIPLT